MTAAARAGRGRSARRSAVARLACALTDPQVRDTLYALAVGDDAGQAEALWALLARTLPVPWRVEALVLLAFSAYVRGDGPLAGVSLEAALRCDPEPSDGGHARSPRCSQGCGPSRSANSPQRGTGSPSNSGSSCRSRGTSVGGRAEAVVR